MSNAITELTLQHGRDMEALAVRFALGVIKCTSSLDEAYERIAKAYPHVELIRMDGDDMMETKTDVHDGNAIYLAMGEATEIHAVEPIVIRVTEQIPPEAFDDEQD